MIPFQWISVKQRSAQWIQFSAHSLFQQLQLYLLQTAHICLKLFFLSPQLLLLFFKRVFFFEHMLTCEQGSHLPWDVQMKWMIHLSWTYCLDLTHYQMATKCSKCFECSIISLWIKLSIHHQHTTFLSLFIQVNFMFTHLTIVNNSCKSTSH